MKKSKIYLIGALAIGMVLASCTDLNTEPQGALSGTQHDNALNTDPNLLSSELSAMLFTIGAEYNSYGVDYARADDFGYPADCLSEGTNSGDIVGEYSGYNWFSAPCNFTDRNTNYANTYERWMTYYKQVKAANDLLNSLNDNGDEEIQQSIALAKAVRAWDYFQLVQKYAFNYVGHENDKAVPLYLSSLDEGADTITTARQTVKTVYAQIEKDLDYAEEKLTEYTRPDKSYIDISVVYGLKARVALVKQEWAKAAEYARKAIDAAASEGITPATQEQVSKVGSMFYSMDETNWMWGMSFGLSNIETNGEYETWVSQFSSLASYSYTTECGVYRSINAHLYNTISSTDVRKGWWVDENLESPLITGLTWSNSGETAPLGQACGNLFDYLPYTNVKFGCYNGELGTTSTCADFPLMRVEEMYLILAEAQGRQNESQGIATLESFVKEYRDPQYSYDSKPAATFVDEVWRQRRIELWGEGFAMEDILRLNKPMVRILGRADAGSNWPQTYQFNLPAGDKTLLMRLPLSEINGNDYISEDDNNERGTVPSMGDFPDERDGVTDNY